MQPSSWSIWERRKFLCFLNGEKSFASLSALEGGCLHWTTYWWINFVQSCSISLLIRILLKLIGYFFGRIRLIYRVELHFLVISITFFPHFELGIELEVKNSCVFMLHRILWLVPVGRHNTLIHVIGTIGYNSCRLSVRMILVNILLI